jgi:hypothetical protein
MYGTCSAHCTVKLHTLICNLEDCKAILGYPEVDAKIILKCDVDKCYVKV